MNEFITNLIALIFETLDEEYKNSPEDFIYNDNEKEVSFSIFERPTSNIPIATSSNHSSLAINSIAFPKL